VRERLERFGLPAAAKRVTAAVAAASRLRPGSRPARGSSFYLVPLAVVAALLVGYLLAHA
jgi:hypothetical protein